MFRFGRLFEVETIDRGGKRSSPEGFQIGSMQIQAQLKQLRAKCIAKNMVEVGMGIEEPGRFEIVIRQITEEMFSFVCIIHTGVYDSR